MCKTYVKEKLKHEPKMDNRDENQENATRKVMKIVVQRANYLCTHGRRAIILTILWSGCITLVHLWGWNGAIWAMKLKRT